MNPLDPLNAARLFERVVAKCARGAASRFIELAERVETRPSLSREEKRVLARNLRFRGSNQGRRAFVIGNGPSLNKIPLERLKDELVFAVNGFACHDIIKTWQPTFLVLADPLYFRKPDVYAGEFALMRERLGDCQFFVPLTFRKAVEQHALLPAERCFYSHMSGSMARHRNFAIDVSKPVPGGQTVTLFAILLSLYMGCDPIYLIGMDHDFLAAPQNPTHFSATYESTLTQGQKKQLTFESWSYLKLIRAVELMFAGYSNLKEVADSAGHRIYNATAGGYLDVFPRIPFDQIFREESDVKGPGGI